MNLDLPRFLLDPFNLKVHFLRLLKQTLLSSYKKTQTRLFNQFFNSKSQKKDYLEINSRLNPLMSIILSPIQSVIIFINNVKTIVPLLRLLGQIEFYLQFFFFEIESLFIANNISKSQKKMTQSQLPKTNLKRFSIMLQKSLGPLLMVTKLKSNETPSISQKKS